MTTPLAERLGALSRFLVEHHGIWHARPFVATGPALWETAHPHLGAWLDAQPDEAFEPGATPDFADAPEPLGTWAREARELSALPALPAEPFTLEAREARGIPGRKRAQLEAFVGCVLAGATPDCADAPEHVLDWCAGKGHVGRALAGALDRPLVAVEWDAALAETGQLLSDARHRPATFHVCDARGAEAAALVGPGAQAVALHACGDLHAALLRAAAARGVTRLAVAPCCYNRAADEADLVLSAAGRAAGLTLDEHDLDLIHRVVLLAGAGERRRLLQGLAWRLALDLWRREVTGEDAYRTMPTFPPGWLALPFTEFAALFAAHGGLERIPGPEIAEWEPRGHARLAAVLRREAVRGIFARPLEVWLLLDRACLLEEAGYAVELGTFCAASATPRNGLLLARRAVRTA